MKINSATNPSSLAILTFITGLIFLLASHNIFAQEQTAITDDGREVLLKKNGNWQFSNTDRFANTSDDRRVLLKDNGRWQYVKNSPSSTKVVKQNTTIEIQLEKVVVEKYTKRGFKNNRVKTQTVFYLQLQNTADSKAAITLQDSDLALVTVKDNTGETYPVISIEPRSLTFDSNNVTSIIIRAKKSPSILDNAKSMKVVIEAGLFGLKSPLSFKQRISDFEEKDVDGFK